MTRKYTPRFFGRPANAAKPAAPTLPTVPTTPDELAEILTDEKALAAVMAADDEARLEWFGQYNKAVNKADAVAQQVTEQVSATMLEWLQENGAPANRPDVSDLAGELQRRFGPAANTPHPSIYNPRAMGAAIDDMYETSADFFRDIWHNTDHRGETGDRLARLRNAFSENVPSEGGFLVPERLRAEVLRVALETAIVRPRARVIPMDSLRVPFPAIDSTSNVSSVYGGIVAYWTEEGATLTGSQPSFRRLVLDAKKLTAYTDVPNELISDSIVSFQAFVDDLFPEALAFYEDIAFFTGLGVGEPLGFLNAEAAISVSAEAGQEASTIVWENVVKMYSRMLPSSLGRAVWVCSIDSFPELATMALSVGTGGSAIWLNNGASGPPMTILGRPVIFTEKAKTLGTAGDINFVDFGFYLIGDRQAMSARSSEHFKFQSDQTSYRIIERVDGRPWLNDAITPQNSGSTLSPFVKLATRS